MRESRIHSHFSKAGSKGYLNLTNVSAPRLSAACKFPLPSFSNSRNQETLATNRSHSLLILSRVWRRRSINNFDRWCSSIYAPCSSINRHLINNSSASAEFVATTAERISLALSEIWSVRKCAEYAKASAVWKIRCGSAFLASLGFTVLRAALFPFGFSLQNLSARNRNYPSRQLFETLKRCFFLRWLGWLHRGNGISNSLFKQTVLNHVAATLVSEMPIRFKMLSLRTRDEAHCS